MKSSELGIEFVKSFESISLVMYHDAVRSVEYPNGVPTIGYGHTDPKGIPNECSKQQADDWLVNDMQTAVDCVNRKVGPQLTQNQFDALVSFVFNVGCGAFSTSTMLRLLNAGEFIEAALEFPRWSMAGNVVLPGLRTRRLKEEKLFNTV